ncbi:hypothetical protein [Lichenicoccus sp.]|uniref:hypothetical protein n=1 Tax=Lichenicoccus sp. TaxID=2781899 RepID=UPI003D0DC5F3
MSPERFAALADAFGGDLDRWPAAERDAACAHLRQHPDANAMLAGAGKLDDTLAAWTVPPPGAALAGRIAAAAVQSRARARRLRLWLSSLGAAATLAGGVAAGASFMAISTPATYPVIGPLYGLRVLGAPVDQ